MGPKECTLDAGKGLTLRKSDFFMLVAGTWFGYIDIH